MSDARDPVRLSLRLISTSRMIEREVDSLMRARFDSTIARFDFMSALDRYGALTLGDAAQYLLGRLDRSYLTTLREFGGLQAYPSRTKDPDQVDFSTGSVGLGAVAV